MSPLVLALIASQVIDLAPHRSLLLIRMSPKALENPLSSERLFRSATRALEGAAGVSLLSAEQAGVDEGRLAECELDRRLSCWASEVGAAAEHLLVLSMLEEGDGTIELTGFLVDVSAARGKSENEIFERTPVSRASVRTANDDDLLSYFRDVLRPLAVKTGAIAIDSRAPDLSIAIDGSVVGTARAGTTTLRGLPPGTHIISLVDPEKGAIHSEAIDVRADSIARVTAPEREPDLLRMVSLWSGVAVAVAGAAILVAGIAAAPDEELLSPCVGSGCVPESSSRFYARGGVLIVPLGYSLIGAGGITALGSALMPDGDLWVYLSIAAGIAVGAASYGISAAF